MNYEKKQRAYISYMKASCFEYVKELSYALFEYGYGVLLDKKSPRSGEFNKNILPAVNNCEWFILVLDKHIFENYPDESNWIHREVSQAVKENKKIICIKTPGLDADAEIPSELTGKLYAPGTKLIELDKQYPHKTALEIRNVIESDGSVGKFEKAVNRVFSGIYLWRIFLFPILGAIIMCGWLSKFQSASWGNVDILYIFKSFGVGTTYLFNLFYVILGTLLCGVFMYITRKVIRMEIIPLFLSDVAGIVFLSMAARKIADIIFGLGEAHYWITPMANAVWNISELTSIYMIVITLAIQLFLYLFKRSVNFV